jgi:DNA-binding NarL/FixJ family response regulator
VAAADSKPAGEASIRVLLADDVPEFRLLMRVALEQDGRFDVVAEAADGEEAVQLSSSEQPDVVLLDLAMPVLDGLQAIPEIRSCSPRTKVVVLSGAGRPQAEREAMSSGASACLKKGTPIATITSTLLAVTSDA